MHNVIEKILRVLSKPKKYSEKSLADDYIQYNFDKERLRSHKDACFRNLRSQYGIGEIDLGLIYYYNPSIRGNSSSVIFFSANFQYAIKTLQEYEFKTLMRIAEDYSEYMSQNRDTLLVKILGCYTHYYKNTKTRFIIMKNVFSTKNVKDIYDLKGYNLSRNYNQYIKKDKDWLSDKLKLKVVNLNKTKGQLKKDIEFLRSHNIMDYSLAISINTNSCNKYFEGVHVLDSEVISRKVIPTEQYCMGIIDILTSYSECKILENWYNLICLCNTNKSCKNPDQYSKRFIYNLEYNVLIHKDDNKN